MIPDLGSSRESTTSNVDFVHGNMQERLHGLRNAANAWVDV